MSDSVIGSAAQRLLAFADKHAVDESNFDSNDRAVMHGMVLAIQREAVDAFIRDELPGLLLEFGINGAFAAKIAELRDTT